MGDREPERGGLNVDGYLVSSTFKAAVRPLRIHFPGHERACCSYAPRQLRVPTGIRKIGANGGCVGFKWGSSSLVVPSSSLGKHPHNFLNT